MKPEGVISMSYSETASFSQCADVTRAGSQCAVPHCRNGAGWWGSRVETNGGVLHRVHPVVEVLPLNALQAPGTGGRLS